VSKSSRERKVQESKNSLKLSFQGQKFQGANGPGRELARELKGQGVKVPGNKLARERKRQAANWLGFYWLISSREQKGSIPSNKARLTSGVC